MSKEFGSMPLTWTRIGKYSEGVGIYLCDQIVEKLPFDQKSNEWDGSDIKQWLNEEFYNQPFSDEQKKSIVFNADANARVFLLSVEEYERLKTNISNAICDWWLRSPGYNILTAAFVYDSDDLDSLGDYVFDGNGVRPAILLRKEEG